MERTVTSAVRGKPTTAPSRTAHFHSRGRAQTTGRRTEPDSSASESDQETFAGTRATGASSSEDVGDSSFDGESDSPTEMALISDTFKYTSGPNQVIPASTDP